MTFRTTDVSVFCGMRRLDVGGVAAAGHPCAGAIASETFCSHRKSRVTASQTQITTSWCNFEICLMDLNGIGW